MNVYQFLQLWSHLEKSVTHTSLYLHFVDVADIPFASFWPVSGWIRTSCLQPTALATGCAVVIGFFCFVCALPLALACATHNPLKDACCSLMGLPRPLLKTRCIRGRATCQKKKKKTYLQCSVRRRLEWPEKLNWCNSPELYRYVISIFLVVLKQEALVIIPTAVHHTLVTPKYVSRLMVWSPSNTCKLIRLQVASHEISMLVVFCFLRKNYTISGNGWRKEWLLLESEIELGTLCLWAA